MDIWPKRAIFRSALKEWTHNHGKTQEEFAELLGISLPHLRNSLYRTDKRLSLDALQRAAGIFGCSVAQFIDDPGEAIEGVPQDESLQLSDVKRLVMTAMYQNFRRDEITDEMAMQYLKILEAAIAAGRLAPLKVKR